MKQERVEELEAELQALSEAYVQRLETRECGICKSTIADGDTHRPGCRHYEVEVRAIIRSEK